MKPKLIGVACLPPSSTTFTQGSSLISPFSLGMMDASCTLFSLFSIGSASLNLSPVRGLLPLSISDKASLSSIKAAKAGVSLVMAELPIGFSVPPMLSIKRSFVVKKSKKSFSESASSSPSFSSKPNVMKVLTRSFGRPEFSITFSKSLYSWYAMAKGG